jgi:glutaredoxin 3
MSDRVLIFGTDSCPYTTAAREDYAKRNVPFEYKNVKEDSSALDEMLRHSDGKREQPVIVEGGKVTIGFGGT